jgi:hypothetical protein
MRMWLLAALAAMGGVGGIAAQSEPLLQLQGKPYFDGDMTLHVIDEGSVGQAVWLGLGLDPLPFDAPVMTNKGPWYIGTLTHVLVLGAIPAGGQLDLPFTMPGEIPAAVGLQLPMQVLVQGELSNPAPLPLDVPYLLPENAVAIDHPAPSQQAHFGDKVAAGDFNDDGVMDLAVGAWFEDVGGVDKAGRVYVLWGPDFSTYVVLEPAVPAYRLHFGDGLAVADFDGDDVDDLAVGEGSGGDPPTPGAHGHVYLFRGGGTFSLLPWRVVTSQGTGQEAAIFGRVMGAGDIDGDAIPDLVIGAPDATVQGHSKAGRIEVFYGPGFAGAQLTENPNPKPDDFFGSRVSLGDVSGDAILDIVEASGRASVGGISQVGRLHVYDGPSLTLVAVIDNPHPAAGDRFGEGLYATDLDGDDRVEVITSDVKGAFYVVWDVLTGATISSWPKPPSPNSTPAATSFGYFFAATDANGDDLVDIVIADPFEGDSVGCGLLSAGGVLYVSLAPFYSTYNRLANPLSACGDEFSWNLIAADVNGDGSDELVAGNDTADVGGTFNAGRVVIVGP